MCGSILFAFLPLLLLMNACASQRTSEAKPAYLHNLGCRIASVAIGPPKTITPIVDVNLDTLSSNPADQTFEAIIHDNRKLTARIQSVNIDLPRDRFNVAMTLDKKTLLRVNHMDLDIYIESTIDEHVYAIHCFDE